MNDSDQIKDLPSDPDSQKKFIQKQIHIENLLNQTNSTAEGKNPLPAAQKSSPSHSVGQNQNNEEAGGTREVGGTQEIGGTPADKVGTTETRLNPETKTVSTKVSPLPSIGKQLGVLATHTLMGAFILLLILLIAPSIISKISWIKPSTKPFFIVGTWILCALVVNLIFLLTKTKNNSMYK